jgi:hypothetical protein
LIVAGLAPNALAGWFNLLYNFILTLLAVHWYLPALICAGVFAGPARADLQTVRSLNRLYLALTALVLSKVSRLGSFCGVSHALMSFETLRC